MSASAISESVAIIIPVRNMLDQARECVRSITPQLRAGDQVVIVDDASYVPLIAGDFIDTLPVINAEVIVTRCPTPIGPYAARNIGAALADTDFLLFIDARCRARERLVDAHRRLLAQPGTGLSCTQTYTLASTSIASRIAAARQPFELRNYLAVPGRLDYFPTANLGVRAELFRAVGGFEPIRSGADAQFCWRIQEAGLGRLSADTAVLMNWIPRDSLQELLGQYYRYGRSSVDLAQVGESASPSRLARLRHSYRWLRHMFGADDVSAGLAAAGLALQVAYEAGRVHGQRERAHSRHRRDELTSAGCPDQRRRGRNLPPVPTPTAANTDCGRT